MVRLRPPWILLLASVLLTTKIAGGQTFEVLASFDGTNGAYPYSMSLVQAIDGNFYGSTISGGVGTNCVEELTCGTVFRITPDGVLTNVVEFEYGNGAWPYGGVTMAEGGELYGTTSTGGADNNGTAFEIDRNGILTTIAVFCSQSNQGICTSASAPAAGVTQALNGNLYGTTELGGIHNFGAVYEISEAGLDTLYSFCTQQSGGFCADGLSPESTLVQGIDGYLYGTTSGGGLYEAGTVFKISPQGAFSVVYNFASPGASSLIQGMDGYFYGTNETTAEQGSVFRVTPTGELATLYTFCSLPNCEDGSIPKAPLIQASDGNLYGTTSAGGAYGLGTVFRVTLAGQLTTLHSFSSDDGSKPTCGLLQGTDGRLYGAAYMGGVSNDGTIFRLALGLGPFVRTTPVAGAVGSRVTILGNDLLGTKAVTFNGVPASFEIGSNTYVSATVPTGATTGRVQVSTPARSLSSDIPFRVRPE